jgi:hypothetical protein
VRYWVRLGARMSAHMEPGGSHQRQYRSVHTPLSLFEKSHCPDSVKAGMDYHRREQISCPVEDGAEY